MNDYVLSPRAQRDLDEIWDYTAATWSVEQAATYLWRIQAFVEPIAAAPDLAWSCDGIRAGYRKYPTGSHVIFFRLTGAAVEIVRILHNRMDVERHL